MTNLRLALSAFRRHRGRALFTVLSVATAFAIFIVLAAIRQGLTGQIDYTLAQRLITVNKMMNGDTLPVSYAERIGRVPGVSSVAWSKQFMTYFQKPSVTVPVLTFSPEVLRVYPEFRFADDGERAAFVSDRRGAIAGPVLAQRMGWKVGDMIPLEGGPVQKNGSTTWLFRLDGIYRAKLPEGYQSLFIAHFDYYNEGIADQHLKDRVYQFDVLIANPRDISRVSHAIDEIFADASPQTLTFSEQQLTLSGLREFGDVGRIIIYIGAAVFFSMLLITGNTMANSVRERLGEFAMMRTLGFSGGRLARLVLVEALVMTCAGAAIGMLAGWEICRLMSPYVTEILQAFGPRSVDAAAAVALALLFSVFVGIGPGLRLTSLPVAEALRSN